MCSKFRCGVWEHFENIIEEGVAECKLCKLRIKTDGAENLKRHLKRHDTIQHYSKTEIWKYFDKIINEEGFAKCKECKELVRINRWLNLKSHMLKAHNIVINGIDGESSRQKKQLRPTATATTVDLIKTEGSLTMNINDKSIDNMLERPTVPLATGGVDNANVIEETQHNIGIDMDEKVIMTAAWGLMIDEGVAPSLFDSKNMQALIQPICEAISKQKGKEFKIDQAEREGVLRSVANNLSNDFTNDLQWRMLSLKIDTDLNGPANTFCVSVSFVTEGIVRTRILGVIDDLKGDSHVTQQHIEQVLHKFNIDADQIVFACLENTKSKYNMHVKNSEYLNEIASIEKFPDIKFGNIKIEPYVGSIAHLCLLDIFKNNDIYQQFLNCRNFVKFISDESNGFYDIFKKNKLNVPQLDSPWKWGSTYKMLSDLHVARKVLEAKIYTKLDYLEDQFVVNDNFWLFVDAFCETLKHIQKSITKYNKEEMHFGDFYGQWLKCKLLTAKLTTINNQNNYVNMISSQLLKSIEIRTKDLLSRDVFQACLYMDPRFQQTLGLEEKSKAVDYLDKLWSFSKTYNPNFKNQSRDFQDEDDAFLNEFLSQDTISYDIHKKIEELQLPFKPVNTNILLFWDDKKNTDTEMYILSSICFAIPATQNYYQEVYTHIYKTKSTSTSESTRDILAFVRLNSHFLVGDIKMTFYKNFETLKKH